MTGLFVLPVLRVPFAIGIENVSNLFANDDWTDLRAIVIFLLLWWSFVLIFVVSPFYVLEYYKLLALLAAIFPVVPRPTVRMLFYLECIFQDSLWWIGILLWWFDSRVDQHSRTDIPLFLNIHAVHCHFEGILPEIGSSGKPSSLSRPGHPSLHAPCLWRCLYDLYVLRPVSGPSPLLLFSGILTCACSFFWIVKEELTKAWNISSGCIQINLVVKHLAVSGKGFEAGRVLIETFVLCIAEKREINTFVVTCCSSWSLYPSRPKPPKKASFVVRATDVAGISVFKRVLLIVSAFGR